MQIYKFLVKYNYTLKRKMQNILYFAGQYPLKSETHFSAILKIRLAKRTFKRLDLLCARTSFHTDTIIKLSHLFAIF